MTQDSEAVAPIHLFIMEDGREIQVSILHLILAGVIPPLFHIIRKCLKGYWGLILMHHPHMSYSASGQKLAIKLVIWACDSGSSVNLWYNTTIKYHWPYLDNYETDEVTHCQSTLFTPVQTQKKTIYSDSDERLLMGVSARDTHGCVLLPGKPYGSRVPRWELEPIGYSKNC